MKTYIEDGNSITWTNDTGVNVVAGQVVVMGSLLGVAAVDISASNLVTNGTFATDTAWTKGSPWSIGSGIATRTASGSTTDLSQSYAGMVATRKYLLSYTITAVSAGSLTALLGQGTVGLTRSAVGRYTELLIAGSGDTLVVFRAGATFAGSIDNVVLTPLDRSFMTSGFGTVLTAREIYTVPKVTGTAWVMGQKLAWDVSAAAFDVQATYSQASQDIEDNAIAHTGAEAATTGLAWINCDVGTVV